MKTKIKIEVDLNNEDDLKNEDELKNEDKSYIRHGLKTESPKT